MIVGHNAGKIEILEHPVPQPDLSLEYFWILHPREVWAGLFTGSLFYSGLESLQRPSESVLIQIFASICLTGNSISNVDLGAVDYLSGERDKM